MNAPITIDQLKTDSSTFAHFQVNVPEDLPFFPGHFPQKSVLPGVVIIDWVVQYAERLLTLKVNFSHMESIKFKQVICPPLCISIELNYNSKTQKLAYTIHSEKGEHSSGKISICMQ